MDFVLVEDSVITAYTNRVSKIVEGVGKLQDKMNAILENTLGDNFEKSETSFVSRQNDNIEPLVDNMEYSEPVVEEPVEDSFDYMDEDALNDVLNDVIADNIDAEVSVGSQFDEPEQATASHGAAIDMSVDSSPEDSNQLDDDLDIDLDAMLEGISFESDDLEL